MSKVGFWLRGSKGKLAGATMYQSANGTIMREVVTPTNPKTQKQMIRRATFIAAVEFFHRGQKNLFPFAFEDKKQGWSDFNAFMHHNSNRGIMLSAQAKAVESYPAIGEYIMSRGSLPEVNVQLGLGDVPHFKVLLDSYTPSAGTVPMIKDVSQALISTYGIAEGDIVTLVGIAATHAYAYPEADPVSVSNEPVIWDIVQFTVNSASTMPVPTVGTSFTPTVYGEGTQSSPYYLAFNDEFGEVSKAAAFAIIVSRNTLDGTIVSNSQLRLNRIAGAAVADAADDNAYRAAVLASWGAKDAAILQGSLVQQSDNPRITVWGNNWNGSTGEVSFVDDYAYAVGDQIELYVKGVGLTEEILNNPDAHGLPFFTFVPAWGIGQFEYSEETTWELFEDDIFKVVLTNPTLESTDDGKQCEVWIGNGDGQTLRHIWNLVVNDD